MELSNGELVALAIGSVVVVVGAIWLFSRMLKRSHGSTGIGNPFKIKEFRD